MNRHKNNCKEVQSHGTHWLDSCSSVREATTADRGKSTLKICYRLTSTYALLPTYCNVTILAALNVRIVRSTRKRCVDTHGLYEFEPHDLNVQRSDSILRSRQEFLRQGA